MSTLRTFLAVSLLVAAGSSVAQAQRPQGGPPGAGRMAPAAVVERWLEGVTLTATQRAAVDSVKARYEPQLMALRGGMRTAMQGGGNRDSLMAKLDTLQSRMAGEVRATLTAEQQPAFDQNREAAEARRRSMIQRRPGGPR